MCRKHNINDIELWWALPQLLPGLSMHFACGWRCGMSSINKVNSQFIVTAYRFFQIIRLYTATIWHFGRAPSRAAIEGRGLGNCELEPSISCTLLLV